MADAPLIRQILLAGRDSRSSSRRQDTQKVTMGAAFTNYAEPEIGGMVDCGKEENSERRSSMF